MKIYQVIQESLRVLYICMWHPMNHSLVSKVALSTIVRGIEAEQQLLLTFHCTPAYSHITPVSNHTNLFCQHVHIRTAGRSCSTKVRGIEVEQYGYRYHSIALLVQKLFGRTRIKLTKYVLYMYPQIQHI